MPPETPVKLPPRVTIGSVVQYFPQADASQDPRAAVITGPWPLRKDGVLNLCVIEDGWQELQPLRGVHWMGSEHLQSHPKIQRARGGWDTLSRKPEGK